ncbi:UNVERIFIED_CONTAM: hypothetical protein Sradi_0002700 [Sesamum radiatum]|uniref:Uncharacterized protein n=1 Tax=Sesamum radiatum TaxID=300843 RepID=A0AAW2WG92_SESRA
MVDTQAEATGVTAAMAGATEDARGTHNEKLEQHGANHPGMVLASAPLTVPTVNRAYVMVSRVERQKEVHMEIEQTDNVAMNTRVWYKRDGMVKGGQRKKGYVDKHSQYCDHCERSGHTREICFKLHRTPEWYKSCKTGRKRRQG